MKQYITFLKKEITENLRGGKMLLIFAVFVIFGIMNPAIAKLTPLMIESLKDALSESGMQITEVTVNALTSWTQFFKNIPMAMIIFAIAYSSVITSEYSHGTLVLNVSRGLSKNKIILAKLPVVLIIWTLGYYISFGITYLASDILWDNSIAFYINEAVFCQWLFGIFIIALIFFFSALFKNAILVILGTGAPILFFTFIGLFPKLARFIPTALMNSGNLLTGAEKISYYTPSIMVTAILSLVLIAASFPIINNKEL